MNESQIFITALNKSTPAERAAYLDRACASDSRLRKAVEALLRVHETDTGFLEVPAQAFDSTLDLLRTPDTMWDADSVQPGVMLAGRYQLLEPIGAGGMGSVWMAQQIEPVKRTVAIKLIKLGMDSKAVIARFEVERQALALMDHPNIAKVLDGGTAPDGRPFFVMELVDGVPITKFCDEHGLNIRQRLELFVQVCLAVQHAHQKGIIHRDIKPRNVLIAICDERPVSKVIDFGVAKATGPQLTEATLQTGLGTVLGTPEYMSPEQASLNNLDVDTRSDVYSLGVLLYELLTGSTPLCWNDSGKSGLLELLRIIREEQPPRPSTKLKALQSRAIIAEARQSDPTRLARAVRGELDWIVMKALEKDRNRRYVSANGFATDVQRYLADEAVTAAPPSAGYRLRKFTLRNKVPVLAVVGVLLALVGGIISTSWQAIRAERLRQEATTQEGLANANLVKARTQIRRAEENFQNVLAAVDQWLKEPIDQDTPILVKEELYQRPEVAELMRVPLNRAVKFFEDFVEQKRADTETRLERAWAYLQIGRICMRLANVEDNSETQEQREKKRQEQYARSEAAYRESIALLGALIEEDPGDVRNRVDQAKAYSSLGEVLETRSLMPKLRNTEEGKQSLNGADSAYRRAGAICDCLARDSLEREHRYQLALAYSPIVVFLVRQPHEDPLAVSREQLSLLEKLVAERPAESSYAISLAAAQSQLATGLYQANRAPEAILFEQAAVVVMERAVSENPNDPKCVVDLAGNYSRLAILLTLLKRNVDAEAAYRSAVAVWERHAANLRLTYQQRFQCYNTYRYLGGFLKTTGRGDEAAETYIRELRLRLAGRLEFPKQAAQDPLREFLRVSNIAGDLEELHRPREAEEAYRQAIAIAEQGCQVYPTLALFQRQLGSFRNNLANVLMNSGRFQEAEREYKQAIAIYARLSADLTGRDIAGTRPADNPENLIELVSSTNNLGVLATRTGRLQEANQAFTDCISILKKLRTEFNPQHEFNKRTHERSRLQYADLLALCLTRLGNTLRETNKFAEAEAAYREALAIRLKEFPQDKSNSAPLAYLLSMSAEALLLGGRDAEATKALSEAAGAWVKLTNYRDGPRELALAYHRLGLLHEKGGRKEEAEADRRLRDKYSPDFATSLAQIALRQTDFQNTARWYRDPQRALTLSKHAVELAPENWETWKALGIARYRIGDWQGVFEPINKSFKLGKRDVITYFFLAMAEHQLGRKEAALDWYGKAVEWMDRNNPKSEGMRRCRVEAELLLGVVGKK